MEKNNKKKILITGALGHIGTGLICSLEGELILIDNLESRQVSSLYDLPDGNRYNFVQEDIRTISWDKYLGNVSHVIHLATYKAVDNSKDRPEDFEQANIQGLKRLADACAKHGIKLFFPSTISVYGSTDKVMDESSDIVPQSPYAQTKHESEQYLQKLDNLKYAINRFGTTYGKSIGMRFDIAVTKFVWQAVNSQPIIVWRTAWEQRRPYLYLGDCVDSIKHIIENDMFNRQIYNVLSQNATVQEVIDIIKQYIPELKVEFVDSPIMNQLSYDVSDAKFRSTGFTPRGTLKTGIGEMIEQFRGIITK